MAAKRFHIEKPEQLQSLMKYAKTNDASIARMARIWKNAKQKKGQTRWDTGVYACFSGDMSREAVLYRASEDEMIGFGKLKYNMALAWCEQHLRRVYE